MKSGIYKRKRKGKKKVDVTRKSDVESALKGEVKEFLDRGLKERFERVFDTDEYVEAYFDWFGGLERIGNGSVRKTMERMKFQEKEHLSLDALGELMEKEGEKCLWEGVSLMMVLTNEVLEQIVMGVRCADKRWVKPIRNLIHIATDVVVIDYAIRKHMDLPPDIIQRCRSGEQVSNVEYVASAKKNGVYALFKSGDEDEE